MRFFLLVALLAACAGGARPSPLPVAVSDSLLAVAREAHWSGDSQRAVPIFRAHLAGHPEDRALRFDLANALAWSGRPQEALALYGRLLLDDPGDLGLLQARANALNWSGRYEEAFAAYRSLPGTGAGGEEIERQIAELRTRLEPKHLASSEYFHDSGGITTARVQGSLRSTGSVLTGLQLSAGVDRIEGPDESVRGTFLSARIRQVLAGGHVFSVDAGAVAYEGSRTDPRIGLLLQTRTARNLGTRIFLAYRDRAFDLKSLRAHEAEVRGTEVGLSSYWMFRPSSGLYTAIRRGWMDDGNLWAAGDLSLDRSLPAGLSLAASAYGIGYAQAADAYYSPAEEWNLAIRLTERLDLGRRTRVALSGWTGRIGNEFGNGKMSGAEGEISARVIPQLELLGSAHYSSSRRESTYISRTYVLSLRWSE